jgi:AcrR family transcriptional regulator
MAANEDLVRRTATGGASRLRLLEAAESCLLQGGYAGLSTRSVAEAAKTPLSQIHYHFGSKQGLVLALLEHQNEKLLRRQAVTLTADAPLSARWLQACDHLDEDLASGYVRVLQEIIAAGYSDPEMAAAAREVLRGWYILLIELGREMRVALGAVVAPEGPELGALIGAVFMGAESMLLIGMEAPIRESLRDIGRALQALEGKPGDAR